ncbi:MAG: GMP synthase [Methanobacteriota archaeon]|nr:MAG: GMP synthase [Euryarchaeota archaeon]
MDDTSLVIDVIDNGGQWTHREWRMLRYLGVDTQILPNKTPLDELREVDGLILSGGAARVGLTGELGNCGGYLSLDVPILGICAGHQFMAGFLRRQGSRGAQARVRGRDDNTRRWRRSDVRGDAGRADSMGEPQRRGRTGPPWFRDYPGKSESCEVQGMENKAGDRFGLQFHPEVNDSEYGARIFENFVAVCERAHRAR